MPLINNSVYFVHIPRTGGRYIENLFKKNNYKYEYAKFYTTHLSPSGKQVEIPHIEYPYYTVLFKNKNIKTFTVVRNPIDRFKSTLKYNNIDKEKILSNENNFKNFINSQIIGYHSNWTLPQINFISCDTCIWKYEDGLGDNFLQWLNKNFNFTFENKFINYKLDKRYDTSTEIQLTKEQMQYIKNYYYKDFKILGY